MNLISGLHVTFFTAVHKKNKIYFKWRIKRKNTKNNNEDNNNKNNNNNSDNKNNNNNNRNNNKQKNTDTRNKNNDRNNINNKNNNNKKNINKSNNNNKNKKIKLKLQAKRLGKKDGWVNVKINIPSQTTQLSIPVFHFKAGWMDILMILL